MKLKLLFSITLLFFSSAFLQAQTDGTLTFNFTQGAPVDTNDGGCALAVWIQNGTTFTKTNLRYVGSGTDDHLPTYGAKAGWTTVNNARTANAVDAVTGATRKNSSTPAALDNYSVSWDGTDVSGNTVTDGTYTIWYEAAWIDGTDNESDFVNTGFSFTKGTSIFTSNPNDVGPLSAMTITWTPSTLSLDSVYKNKISLYPNPSKGIINISYKDIPVSKIDVVNILGQIVKSIKLDPSKSQTSKRIDLSSHARGLYIINVSTNETSSSYKVVLDK
jgi:hypothetical protein